MAQQVLFDEQPLAFSDLVEAFDAEDSEVVNVEEPSPSFYREHQQYLTAGISTVDTAQYDPSKIYMFGKTAFPVLCNQAGSCNIAAATHGKVLQ